MDSPTPIRILYSLKYLETQIRRMLFLIWVIEVLATLPRQQSLVKKTYETFNLLQYYRRGTMIKCNLCLFVERKVSLEFHAFNFQNICQKSRPCMQSQSKNFAKLRRHAGQ